MVVFVTYSSSLGGAERLLLAFASGCSGERVLACPEGPLACAAPGAGLRVIPLRAHRLAVRASLRDRALTAARLWCHGREVAQLVGDLDPTAVVLWSMRSAIAVLLVGALDRRTVFVHNDMLPGSVTGVAVRAAARRVGIVVAPSVAVASDLTDGGRWGQRLRRRAAGERLGTIATAVRRLRPPAAPAVRRFPDRAVSDRVRVISPGVDVDAFRRAGRPPRPPEVLVLGALVAWKRPGLALEVFSLARRQVPDARLRFVGAPLPGDPPGLMAQLRDRASRPDLARAVEFAGAVDDPSAALARCWCLLHCADREPFGLAVLEALATGRPAIVAAGGGPEEIVDRSCGLVYPPGDPVAAARALVGVLSDAPRAAALGAAGRERAVAHFDAGQARSRFAEVVAEVSAPRRRPTSPGEGAVPVRADSLAVVTVTHNSAPALQALLRSVARHLPGATVVVVDCASQDDSVAVARGWRLTTTVALEENVGFGTACNRGVAAVSRPVTLLLNPDVELLDDSLLALAGEALAADRLLAPLVLTGDGTRQDSVHGRPGSASDLLAMTLPSRLLFGRVKEVRDPWRSTAPRRVEWAVACALAARTDILARLGPFDERIFLYGEDLDLGLRAAASGIETWFWPDARVLHHGAHASRPRFGGEPFERLARGRREVVSRQLGPRRAALDDAIQAATFAGRIVGKPLLGRSAARERAQLRGLAAAQSSPRDGPAGHSARDEDR